MKADYTVKSGGSVMKRTSRFRGFTLVEVLVALVVFTVVSVALVRNATQSLKLAGAVRDKTVAMWLAENEMTELRLQPRSDAEFPGAGTDREVVETGELAWDVETRIDLTENDYMRRVTILVYPEDQDVPAATLTGFLGRY